MKNPLIDLEMKVSDLLDHETGDWNREALDENFFPGDVEIILKKKPVPSVEDFWCWKHNRSGEYTVRSGNWLALHSMLKEEFQEAQMQPSINCLKDSAWHTLTSPKIKMFLWRTLSQIIPVANTLKARGMKVDQLCQHCGLQDETLNHLLFTCDVARQVWALSNFPSPMNGFHPESIFVNFHYLFQMSTNIRVPKDIRCCFPWILWFLWKNRNKLLFEGSEFKAEDIVHKAYDEAAVWFEAQKLDREGEKCDNEPVSSALRRWSKPPRHWVKCNYGYVWNKPAKMLGAAWIVRDHHGDTILHSRRSFADVNSKQEAQLVALRWSLDSLAAHRFDRIIIAGEDATLLKVIGRPKAWPSFTSEFITLRSCLNHFTSWKSKVESRFANRCAFSIAKSAHQLQWGQSYVARGCPQWLSSLFLDDKG